MILTAMLTDVRGVIPAAEHVIDRFIHMMGVCRRHMADPEERRWVPLDSLNEFANWMRMAEALLLDYRRSLQPGCRPGSRRRAAERPCSSTRRACSADHGWLKKCSECCQWCNCGPWVDDEGSQFAPNGVLDDHDRPMSDDDSVSSVASPPGSGDDSPRSGVASVASSPGPGVLSVGSPLGAGGTSANWFSHMASGVSPVVSGSGASGDDSPNFNVSSGASSPGSGDDSPQSGAAHVHAPSPLSPPCETCGLGRGDCLCSDDDDEPCAGCGSNPASCGHPDDEVAELATRIRRQQAALEESERAVM